MEEEKAAAYYDELTRKGEGAARFKQGLGFSAASDAGNVPARGSALPSSSFLSSFVKASSPSKGSSEPQKQAQLESIQNKLKKKKEKESEKRRPSRDEERDLARTSRRDDRRNSRRRSRSRERERDRRRRSRSRERNRDRRRRSRSRSDSDGDRRRRERRSRSSSPRKRRAEVRNRSRSSSPRKRRADRRIQSRSRSSSPRDRRSVKDGKVRKERNGGADYSRLIEGYDKMSPAEKVKAKMKLQLAETVEKDATKGSSGWERFEFNKDAPLDDEEIEAAEDDTTLVKHIGQSFRFSAVEAKREEQIRAAHEEAIFGAPVILPSISSNDDPEPDPEPETETETNEKESNGSDLAASLLSEKVLAKQQGSWRDRARRQRN